MMMNGITSLDGHGKSSGDMNKAMERMSIVFKGRLSPDQLEAIKQDIQSTVMAPMAGDMLSNAGEGGDTMMAHMSPDMMGMAQEMGVLPDGNVNPMTGKQYPNKRQMKYGGAVMYNNGPRKVRT